MRRFSRTELPRRFALLHFIHSYKFLIAHLHIASLCGGWSIVLRECLYPKRVVRELFYLHFIHSCECMSQPLGLTKKYQYSLWWKQPNWVKQPQYSVRVWGGKNYSYRLLIDFIYYQFSYYHACSWKLWCSTYAESAKDACKNIEEDAKRFKQNELTGERPSHGEGMIHINILYKEIIPMWINIRFVLDPVIQYYYSYIIVIHPYYYSYSYYLATSYLMVHPPT